MYRYEPETRWLGSWVLDEGLFERFNVLKRFVDAEIDWIEDDAV